VSAAKTALLLAAGVCAFALPAGAQTAPPLVTPLSQATVQAAPAPAEVTKEVRSFVQSYAARSARIDQIPRWNQAVCVQVKGLVGEQAAVVAARIEDVAKGAGLKVQKPGCQSNIQVMFTDQPQRLLDKAGEQYLGFHYQNELKKVRAVTHPIQGWYATSTIGAAGATAAGLAFAGGSGKPSGGGGGMALGNPGSDAANPAAFESNSGPASSTLSKEVVDSPDRDLPTGCGDSRFSSCMRSTFANVMIVADTHAIGGKELGVLTDYVAMLALAQPKSLDGCNALPSVIDLFAKPACPGRDPPDGLTPADVAYLASLYASDPEARTTSAQGDIAGHMAKILTTAQAVAR
jgi:hypothetical protein